MPGPTAKHWLGELPTLNFYEADDGQRQRIKVNPCIIGIWKIPMMQVVC